MQQTDVSSIAPLLGSSRAHSQVLETLNRFAQTDRNVTLSGPIGTRKLLHAIYLHERSYRARAPFILVDCNDSADVIENGLFGNPNGDLTVVPSDAVGFIEAAEAGTLFLQRIHLLRSSTQIGLLRFLEDRKYRRLGEKRLRHANVRVVAAANVDLVTAVHQNAFHQDLFSRLTDVSIAVPSLTERRDDIPMLLDELAKHYAEACRTPRIVMSECAMNVVRDYAWPGNTRELENCVKYLTSLRLLRPVDPCDLLFLGSHVSGLLSTL
jgi:two-component system, NtrC family, response regulator GlrR